MKTENFVVISYFTSKTPYQEEAKKLEGSLKKFNIPHRIMEMPNLRDWQKNTHQKAVFIRKCMDIFYNTEFLVWVDADAIFHKYPVLFDQLDCELAVHFRNWKHGRDELLSGTMFIKNCSAMKDIVNEWIQVNRKNKGTWEQRNLQRVIKRVDHLMKIVKLPVEYCCIFDDEKREKIDPVIEHFQASRRFRRMIR